MIFTLKGRVGIGVGVIVGIFLSFYILIYAPQKKLLEETKEEIARNRVKVSQMKKQLEGYEELEKEFEAASGKLIYLEDLLLKEEDISSFFRELESKAKTYGIEYTQIVPGKVISEEYYNKIPVKMQLYSTYHTLGMLLSDITKMLRGSSVEDIKIKGIGAGKEETLGGNYSVEVNLLMYIYTRKYSSEEEITKREGESESPFKLVELEGEKEKNIQYQRVEARRE